MATKAVDVILVACAGVCCVVLFLSLFFDEGLFFVDFERETGGCLLITDTARTFMVVAMGMLVVTVSCGSEGARAGVIVVVSLGLLLFVGRALVLVDAGRDRSGESGRF